MESLYMFAIMPPARLSGEINKERQTFAENYNCVKALKPPVHITLYDPYKTTSAFEDEIQGLQQWSSNQQVFTVELRNFNFFRNPEHPVVYIDVVKNDALTQLHKKFLLEFRNYFETENANKKYTPHITIGYRDVPPALFPDIINNYSRRPFSASFKVSSIYLWKHDGKNWKIQSEFKFGRTEADDGVQKSLF